MAGRAPRRADRPARCAATTCGPPSSPASGRRSGCASGCSTSCPPRARETSSGTSARTSSAPTGTPTGARDALLAAPREPRRGAPRPACPRRRRHLLGQRAAVPRADPPVDAGGRPRPAPPGPAARPAPPPDGRRRAHRVAGEHRRAAAGEEAYVHARSGRPCRRCGDTVRVAMAGVAPRDRTIFSCPTCQGGLAPTDDGRPQRPLGSTPPARRSRRPGLAAARAPCRGATTSAREIRSRRDDGRGRPGPESGRGGGDRAGRGPAARPGRRASRCSTRSGPGRAASDRVRPEAGAHRREQLGGGLLGAALDLAEVAEGHRTPRRPRAGSGPGLCAARAARHPALDAAGSWRLLSGPRRSSVVAGTTRTPAPAASARRFRRSPRRGARARPPRWRAARCPVPGRTRAARRLFRRAHRRPMNTVPTGCPSAGSGPATPVVATPRSTPRTPPRPRGQLRGDRRRGRRPPGPAARRRRRGRSP